MEKYKVKYFDYDVHKYPFINIVEDLFNIDDLSEVHTLLDRESSDNLFTNENDDATKFHDMFYKKLNSGWDELEQTYKNFIKMVMVDIFNKDSIIYQSSPTFRVQLPNNIAVGGNKNDTPERYGWHKDTDSEYNHPPFEKNFIIPLTNSKDTASVYIETYPNSDEFKSANMQVGKFFQFAGGECVHGNKRNVTGKSRISLDFRIVLKEDYDEEHSKSSKLRDKKFVVGGYYNQIHSI
tara:strand:- start:12904 stop:13614 length:711 start_codon:yes stop_codon:yes gene_type:complete